MEVLGLNGVYPRSHDASACLITDNKIRSFVEEERFVRKKRAFDYQPHYSISYCLEKSDRDLNQLEAITFGWAGPKLCAKDVLPKNYSAKLKRIDELPVIQIRHHEAHA